MIPHPQQTDFNSVKEAIVLGFNNFQRIVRAGYNRINLPDDWTECVADSNLCKDYFVRQLAFLEDECLIEPGKDFKEARAAYLKACFK